MSNELCFAVLCCVQEAAAAVSHVTASAGDAQALQSLLTQQYQSPNDLPTVLVVDPPRKGLDPALLELLLLPCPEADSGSSSSSNDSSSSSSSSSSKSSSGDIRGPLWSVRRLVYLSCGFEALQRDADALLAGGWRVSAAQGFLFFPGTDTIETLVVFDRV
jgi:tRNA/tmRNA/rRNA uracil-C5-methylase (TrmA/RlmC/RlmD family)